VQVWGYKTLTHQAANSQGIQTLLEAEKEAAKVVQKARQCELRRRHRISRLSLRMTEQEGGSHSLSDPAGHWNPLGTDASGYGTGFPGQREREMMAGTLASCGV